jgi:hypothetical protein
VFAMKWSGEDSDVRGAVRVKVSLPGFSLCAKCQEDLALRKELV